MIPEEKESIQEIVEKIGKESGFDFGILGDNSMTVEDEQLQGFKVQRVNKTLNYQDDSTSNHSGQGKTSSVSKTYEENLLQTSAIVNNKLIDQEVLKNVISFNFEKTFNTITERIKNHLKPSIADSLIGELVRTYKPGN